MIKITSKQEFKEILRKVKKHPVFRRAVCRLAYWYIKFVFYTVRTTIINPEGLERIKQGDAPVIFAFWHGHLMMMPCFGKGHRKTHAMISRHGDGDVLSRVMELFDLGMVRGSSSRGGAQAAKEAVLLLEKGDNIAITPDGPRGPRRKAAKGTTKIAELSGCAIIPIGYAASWCKKLNTWDKFLITYPFAKIGLAVGEPIFIAPESNEEAETERLEKTLIELTQKAKHVIV